MRALFEVPGVFDDLRDGHKWISEGGQPTAADRMLVAYDWVTQRLCEQPGMGKLFGPELPEVRMRGLPSPFHRYQVFYRFDAETVRVLAVIHGTRGDETRWADLRGR